MIHIEKEGIQDTLTITMTGYGMADTYTTTISQLIGVLRTQDVSSGNTIEHYYAVLDLLDAMMPDEQQVKAMIGVKADDV